MLKRTSISTWLAVVLVAGLWPAPVSAQSFYGSLLTVVQDDQGGVLVPGELIGGPGWVVIATVPGVVRSQPAVRPARNNAAPAIATLATLACVFIPATICGAAS